MIPTLILAIGVIAWFVHNFVQLRKRSDDDIDGFLERLKRANLPPSFLAIVRYALKHGLIGCEESSKRGDAE